MIETKMVKHVKNMSEGEKINNYTLSTYKHKVNVFYSSLISC